MALYSPRLKEALYNSVGQKLDREVDTCGCLDMANESNSQQKEASFLAYHVAD